MRKEDLAFWAVGGIIVVCLCGSLVGLGYSLRAAPVPGFKWEELRCLDMESGFMKKERWERVHAADEHRMLKLQSEGKVEQVDVPSLLCYYNADPTKKYLVNQTWWRAKK